MNSKTPLALAACMLLALLAAFLLPPGSARAAPNYTTVPRGAVFNTAATGGAAIAAAAQTSRATVAQRLTIWIKAGETNSTLTLRVTRKSDSTYVDGLLNGGTALTAGNAYTFEWGAHQDYTYTLILNTTTVVGFYLLEEVVAP